jgi:hypothetical protein
MVRNAVKEKLARGGRGGRVVIVQASPGNDRVLEEILVDNPARLYDF